MKVMKNLYRRSRLASRKCLFFISAPVLKKISGRLFFSFNSSEVHDGVGAQVQRVMAIAGLAAYLGSHYEHSPFATITSHPMDPYQTAKERDEFLERLNACVMPTTKAYQALESATVFQISQLTLFDLILLAIKSFTLNKNYRILTTEVYGVVDLKPQIYLLHQKFLSVDFSGKAKQINPSSLELCIHYRRGTGGMAVYHKQSSPRELEVGYYLSVIESLQKTIELEKLVVLTDSPLTDSVYKIDSDQIELWKNTPGYFDGALYINGQNIYGDFASTGLSIEVVVGGDPIESLGLMQQAKILIMSRSSFSFVAAILNRNGEIYFPPGFWHPKLENWKSIYRKTF